MLIQDGAPSATAVWPGTGIALAAILLLGYEVWPGIFLGAFAVNLTTAGSVVSSLGIAAGNTLEAVIGAYLVIRFAKTVARAWFSFAGLLKTRRQTFVCLCRWKRQGPTNSYDRIFDLAFRVAGSKVDSLHKTK